MAQQPLSRVQPRAGFEWGSGVLAPYPALACIVMDTISLSAQMEFNWSAILVDLLKSDPKTGVAMYEALSGGESQRAVLMAAAKSALLKDDNTLFQAIWKVLLPAKRLRNQFVHHIWGASSEVPNALLLIDPKCLRKFEVEKSVGPSYPPDVDRSLVTVWREDDLGQGRETVREGLIILGILSEGLAEKPLERAQIGASARERLLNRPEIAQAFQKAQER